MFRRYPRPFIVYRNRHGRRCYANAAFSYNSKVRAFPFAFSKDDAITHVAPAASSLTVFKGFISSVCAKYFPASGFKPIQPDRIQAIYYPAWIVDAEVEAKVWLSPQDSESSQQHNFTVDFTNSYVPGKLQQGCPFDLLGRLAFRDENMSPEQAVPFSQSLTKQHGSDILCLPYTTSPFSLLDKARNLSFKQATIHDGVRFDPSSVKPNLFAAYPVLMPLYIAQYETVAPFRNTFVIQAHSKPGRFFMQTISDDPEKNIMAKLEEHIGYDYLFLGGNPSSFVNPRVLSPLYDEVASSTLESWLNDQITARGATEMLSSGKAIDMEDPRVRQWIGDELRWVRRWIESGEDLLRIKDTVKKISSVGVDLTETSRRAGPGESPDVQKVVSLAAAGLEEFSKAQRSRQEAAEKARATFTPVWWREWEDSQKLKS
ncbi:hypothetical protein BV22DRAFT_1193229 [Leucogyrophana mollusca]|uniref:Uncharacterized protein n=1 Tax=Leucogyrophana mollusca TaxID=85980 RepID=A0ACB8BRA1_9AGAM|nr:hypothetical protein BV22DRAFT_1193229 [Leucogyrophana mollusca]